MSTHSPNEEAIYDAVHNVPRLLKLELVTGHADPVALHALLVPINRVGAGHLSLDHVHQVEGDTGKGRS